MSNEGHKLQALAEIVSLIEDHGGDVEYANIKMKEKGGMNSALQAMATGSPMKEPVAQLEIKVNEFDYRPPPKPDQYDELTEYEQLELETALRQVGFDALFSEQWPVDENEIGIVMFVERTTSLPEGDSE